MSDRLRLATGWVKEALTDIDVQQRINKEVTDDLEKGQREAILRRQMAAIRAELGEGDDDIVGHFRAKLDELTASGAADSDSSANDSPANDSPAGEHTIDAATAEAITREIDQARANRDRIDGSELDSDLASTPSSNCRGPNGPSHEPELDEARSILDADHTGLEEVKERLVEYLAVRKLRAERGVSATDNPDGRRNGVIIALVGPSWSWQDVSRPLGCKGARPVLCPPCPRRHPRRSGDSRPSTHLRRCSTLAALCGRSPKPDR